MNFLNKKQLAFILDIKAEEARAKMCVAWCKDKGITNKAFINDKDKVVDEYPETMPIEMLSSQLNLPTLQSSVDDIVQNYLSRKASRKWILCDYPEKKIGLGVKTSSIKIPPALRSMLPSESVKTIQEYWSKNYRIKS